jgi:hypothetical protein
MKRHLNSEGVLILTTSNAFSIVNFFRIIKSNKIKVHKEHTCWYDPITISQLFNRHSFEVVEMYFTNKSKWFYGKYFYKVKYQLPRFICFIRSYFSGNIVVVARKL